MNPAGGGVSAWPSADAQGSPAVAVREDFPGAPCRRRSSAAAPAARSANSPSARSGLGDGLVAFRQGPLGNAAIVAAQVTAPPDAVRRRASRKVGSSPAGVRSRGSRAQAPNGPLRYQRGPRRASASRRRRALARCGSSARGLGNGTHRVQVLATDIDGQATLTSRRRAAQSTARRPTVTSSARDGGGARERARPRQRRRACRQAP